MASTWTSERFPQFEKAIHKLTEEHRQLEDEPLHLALSYGPDRDQQDIFLFEVIGNNGNETINPERELFETTFSSSRGFALGADQRLHLILTNPREFKTALEEDWPSAREILGAIRAGDYRILHADNTGKRLLRMIRAKLGPRRKVSRG